MLSSWGFWLAKEKPLLVAWPTRILFWLTLSWLLRQISYFHSAIAIAIYFKYFTICIWIYMAIYINMSSIRVISRLDYLWASKTETERKMREMKRLLVSYLW